jgi:endoglucanase
MIPSLLARRLRRFALPLLACAVSAATALAAPAPVPVNPAGFVIRRGTNLSHWLSQDFGWQPRATWITENDLRFIARSGFDHVRLPIDEKELWADDGTPNEEAFATLLRGIGWARASQLRVIVDLHTVRSHHFNAANEGGHNTLFTDPKAQERFIGLWRQLSARLRDQPVDFLAYEIMNEPVADNPEDWNKLVAAAHAVLRQLEPNRVIVIGSNLWQMPHTLPLLKVPAGDKNIILSTHTYSPLLFTHYTADWVPIKTYTGGVRYPGPVVPRATHDALMAKFGPAGQGDLIANAKDDWGPARFAQELAPAITRARELGLQLYCGEFGCLPTVPRADRLAYYRDLIAVFEQNGLAWANWEYKGDFGLFEWHREKTLAGAPDVEFIDVLLAGAKAK